MLFTTLGVISLIAAIVHFGATYMLRHYPFGRLLPLELSFVGVLIFLVSQIYIDYSLGQASLFFLLGIICVAGFIASILALSVLLMGKRKV